MRIVRIHDKVKLHWIVNHLATATTQNLTIEMLHLALILAQTDLSVQIGKVS